MTEALYIVISLKHTRRGDKAVTLWRPNDRGYCWRLEWAGRYPEQQVLGHLGYYNSGCSNIAVPAELVEHLSCEVECGDGESAICLPNNRDIWRQLLQAVIRPAPYPAKPEFPGARYPKEVA